MQPETTMPPGAQSAGVMPPGDPVPFTFSGGQPLRIAVRGQDGQDYEMLVQVVVMGVSQVPGVRDEITGLPRFNVTATMGITTAKKA